MRKSQQPKYKRRLFVSWKNVSCRAPARRKANGNWIGNRRKEARELHGPLWLRVCGAFALRPEQRLPADNKQMAVVLGIYPSFGVQRGRRVRRSDGQLLEDALQEDASLADGVQVAVFAVGVYHAVGIDDGRVHAPFEAIRMVGLATERTVR